MKSKIGFLLTAFLMLLSVGAFAQSGNSDPIKGDVNGDGVVDVADINAIIEIMKNGGGTTVDINSYFFYVGLNKPTSSTNPADELGHPIQTNYSTTIYRSAGWYLIGKTIENINNSNRALDGSDQANNIIVEPTYSTPDGVDFYIVIPEELNIYDGLGNKLNGNYTDMGTVEIGGHTYKIFKAHDYEFIFNIY